MPSLIEDRTRLDVCSQDGEVYVIGCCRGGKRGGGDRVPQGKKGRMLLASLVNISLDSCNLLLLDARGVGVEATEVVCALPR